MLLARCLGLRVVKSRSCGDQGRFHVDGIVVVGIQQDQTPEPTVSRPAGRVPASGGAW